MALSRVGKWPVAFDKGVQATLAQGTLKVKGPKGELQFVLPTKVTVEVKEGKIAFTPKDESREAKIEHGTARAIVANMVRGVTEQFVKELIIKGVGYRAEVKGKTLNLALGFSHPVAYPIPVDISIEVKNQTSVTIRGCDKAKVGQIAAELRGMKPPEPYQGKGIAYVGEVIRRKAGKAAAGAGA